MDVIPTFSKARSEKLEKSNALSMEFFSEPQGFFSFRFHAKGKPPIKLFRHFNYAYAPNNRAPPVPRSDVPSMMHSSLSYGKYKGKSNFGTKKCFSIMHPPSGEATSLRLCKCQLIWGVYQCFATHTAPGPHRSSCRLLRSATSSSSVGGPGPAQAAAVITKQEQLQQSQEQLFGLISISVKTS